MTTKQLRLGLTGLLTVTIAHLCLIASPVLGWGGEGHDYTARLAVRALPEPLGALYTGNINWFARESSFPDRWRFRDNSEAPRHFLDTEHFGFETDVNRIPRTYRGVIELRGYEKLRTDGVIPWTIDRHYKLLVNAFRDRRWEDAMVQSIFLSHYVADAHVPFHASANYDGQLSKPSQRGIHSRFESRMVEQSIKMDDLRVGTPRSISNPIEVAFRTLQDSIDYVDDILRLDRRAVQFTYGNDNAPTPASYDEDYYRYFTPPARRIAIARLEEGGRTLAGYLFSAWSQAGRPVPPADFQMTDRLLPYAPPFPARGERAQPAPPPAASDVKEAARASARTVHVPSNLLGRHLPATILLPKGYVDEANARRRYPVLYLLHGAMGAHDNWNKNSGVAAYVADLPLIVVMPDANRNSFYINTPGRGPYADFFFYELIPFVDSNYRTVNRREGRAIAGLSMGGYGAWRLALERPDLFVSAASMSGALDWGDADPSNMSPLMAQLFVPLYGSVSKKSKDLYAQDRLTRFIEKRHGRDGRWYGPALYFDIGAEDFILAGNRRMEQFLLERGIPHEFAEFAGKHDWEYWDAHVRDAINFSLRHLAPMEQ